jgi:hypothetical protein
VLKLHRISPQLAGHSTASRRAKEAGSRTVVRDIQNASVAVKAHRPVQPQADESALEEVVTLAWQHRAGTTQGWVDHPKGDHDDFANACCGVLRELSTYLGYDYTYRAFQTGFVDEDVV